MNRIQTGTKDLVALVQMVQVAAAVVLAGVAIALGIQGAGVVAVLGVADLHYAIGGEQVAVAGVASRHDAVEHVDTTAHPFHQIFWLADTHQVARLVGRDFRADVL